MRTVTYKSVLQKASALLTNKVAPNTDDGVSLNLFINARYREYFERFFWPELMLVEKRMFRPGYDGTTSYPPESEVFYWPTQTYYQSLRASPVVTIDYDQLWAIVTCAAPHRFITGQRVQISGAIPAAYNGTFTITVMDADRFRYDLPSDPADIDTGTPIVGVHPADANGTVNPAYWAVHESGYDADDWDGAASYTVGAIVRSPVDGRFYQCTLAHTNFSPPNATYWSVLAEFERDLDFDGGNQGASATTIGDVKGVWDSHPWKDEDACSIAFQLTSDGVVVRGTLPVVWVEFRIRPNEFTGAAHVVGTTYAVDDQAYYATTGEFYRCIVTTNSALPTDTSKWVKLEFPYVLGAAVAQAAYADQLKVTGKTSKWGEEIRESLRLLQREFDKIERQQGQTVNLNVQTR